MKKEITRKELIHQFVKNIRMEIEIMLKYKGDRSVCLSIERRCYGVISFMWLSGYISEDYQGYLDYIVHSVYNDCVYGNV